MSYVAHALAALTYGYLSWALITYARLAIGAAITGG